VLEDEGRAADGALAAGPRMDRRRFIATASAAGAALTVAPPLTRGAAAQDASYAPGTPYTTAEYLAFMDRVTDAMEPVWKPHTQAYYPTQSMANARMLLVHSVAAMTGHTGAARQDDRARVLARKLCEAPWFIESNPPKGDQRHLPGWVDGGIQHLVVDAEIAESLAIAWRARDALALEPATVALIADRITRTTAGTYWRYPTIRLNQISWYCRMYMASITVGGSDALLGDLRKQVVRFVDDATRVRGKHVVPNLGGGYRFHYLPNSDERNPFNFDSPEYANITAGFLADWVDARRRGMPGLDAGRERILKAWIGRVLTGYWTHGGYLNWDTGLGFNRWHQGKKVGLSQAALLGIAACAELRPSGGYGAWAKGLLDASFGFWDRQAAAARGLPPANFFHAPSEGNNPYSRTLSSARYAANAARAILLDLGNARGKLPPALYAHDPDTGRLAITTPTYNTAVVPSSRRAFPYGGLDIARLFDGDQEPAANIGGVPPAAFGMVVRDRGGKILLASQRALLERPGTKLLKLTRAPRGTAARLVDYPEHPYAGPFETIAAQGAVRAGSVEIRVAHRFTTGHIQTTWTFAAAAGGSRSVEVNFPSTGPGVHISAVLRDGTHTGVGRRTRIAVSRLAYVYVRGATSGYVIVPSKAPAGAVLTAAAVARQPSSPRADDSARIELATRTQRRGLSLTARYAPARDAAEAARVAARLR
jgi:hypothetical protein